QTPTPALDAAQKQWEEKARADLAAAKPSWAPVRPSKADSSGRAKLVVQPDLSVLSTGKNPAKDTYTLTLPAEQTSITGIRLTALRHASLNGGGLSRGNGNFVLTGFSISLAGPDGKPRPVPLASAVADFAQQGFPVASLLQRGGPGWAVE